MPLRRGRGSRGTLPTGSSDFVGVAFLLLVVGAFMYIASAVSSGAGHYSYQGCVVTVNTTARLPGYSGVRLGCANLRSSLSNASRVLVLKRRGSRLMVVEGVEAGDLVVCDTTSIGPLTFYRRVLLEVRGVEDVVGYDYEDGELRLTLKVRYPEWRPRSPEEMRAVPEDCARRVREAGASVGRSLVVLSLEVFIAVIAAMIALLYLAERHTYEGFSGFFPMR